MVPALTGIALVLTPEVSRADHRGGFLGYIFIANCKLRVQQLTSTRG